MFLIETESPTTPAFMKDTAGNFSAWCRAAIPNPQECIFTVKGGTIICF